MPKDLRPQHISKSHRVAPYPLHMLSNMPHASTLSMDHPSPIASERCSTAWSTEDDQRLMQCRAQGMNWAPIAHHHFPSKTPNACRKRHERLMEKKNNEDWDGVKIEDLARAYIECREEMWRLIADKVGEKWQTVESKCMEKGLKTLQSADRASRRKHASNSPHSHASEEYKDDSGLVADSDPFAEDAYLGRLTGHQPHITYSYQPPPPNTQSISYSQPASYAGYYQPSTVPAASAVNYQVMGGGGGGGQMPSQRQPPPLPSFSQGFEMPPLPSMSTLLHQPAGMHRASIAAASY